MNVLIGGIAFDQSELWLVNMSGPLCTSMTKCKWRTPGSVDALKQFLKTYEKNPWTILLDAACQNFEVEVVVGKAFLGLGAFGRVFRVKETNGENREMALKVVLAETDTTYHEVLQFKTIIRYYQN